MIQQVISDKCICVFFIFERFNKNSHSQLLAYRNYGPTVYGTLYDIHDSWKLSVPQNCFDCQYVKIYHLNNLGPYGSSKVTWYWKSVCSAPVPMQTHCKCTVDTYTDNYFILVTGAILSEPNINVKSGAGMWCLCTSSIRNNFLPWMIMWTTRQMGRGQPGSGGHPLILHIYNVALYFNTSYAQAVFVHAFDHREHKHKYILWDVLNQEGGLWHRREPIMLQKQLNKENEDKISVRMGYRAPRLCGHACFCLNRNLN